MLNVCFIHTEAQTSFREQTHYQCWNLQNLLPGLEQTEAYLSASTPFLHLRTLNLFPTYTEFSQGDLARIAFVHCCSSNRGEQQTMNLFSTLNHQWENPFLYWAHPKVIGKDGLRTEDHLKAHTETVPSLSGWVLSSCHLYFVRTFSHDTWIWTRLDMGNESISNNKKCISVNKTF